MVQREIVTTHPLIEEVLEKWHDKIGDDYPAIRGHNYRMFNFCVALSGRSDPATVKKIAIAAAFHDIGIWTHGTFDYLPPSCDLAMAYLKENENAAWSKELSEASMDRNMEATGGAVTVLVPVAVLRPGRLTTSITRDRNDGEEELFQAEFQVVPSSGGVISSSRMR